MSINGMIGDMAKTMGIGLAAAAAIVGAALLYWKWRNRKP